VIGANLVQQCVRSGLLDEIHLDLVPVLLGDGVRLFDHRRAHRAAEHPGDRGRRCHKGRTAA
jgi:dihydrofolate reductase